MQSAGEEKRKPHVIIVGTGVAGIAAAIQLKGQLDFHNFTIYEKADAVGGTWRDNTYPGCGSDVPGHWYSLSTDLNPKWSSYFVRQPEIRAYWEGLWHKHDLVKHTELGTAVLNAEWNNARQLYHVTVQDVRTGELRNVGAEVMINAVGGFQAPLYPKDISNIEAFKGEIFHSARWRHDVQLKGKRVAVIGNGASAAQFIPEISKDPSVVVVNFCRSPQWYIPRNNYHYPAWVKWVFANIPFVMRWYRNWIMATSDLSYLAFRKNNKRLLALARKILASYIKKKAPADDAERLIPTYLPGCKRILIDPGYLESLKRPNVSIRWDAIDSLVKEGIKLKTGEVVPLDVIIFGTGYVVAQLGLLLKGSNGSTVDDYFSSKGGPTAYAGTCIPGFPNMFLLLGPNVASGHASVIFSQEAQIGLALQLIRPIINKQARSFEITDKATDMYNAWLEKRLAGSVWTDCRSYYYSSINKDKIIGPFPGPVTLFWWISRKPHWGEFKAVGAEAWERQRRVDMVKKWSLVVLLLGLVVTSMRYLRDETVRGVLPVVIQNLKRIMARVRREMVKAIVISCQEK